MTLLLLYRWLVSKRKEEQAIEVLRRARGGYVTDQVLENEVSSIRRAVSLGASEGVREKLSVLLDRKVVQR